MEDNLLELKEKARKYDELQRWFWWLERRTIDGKTSKGNIEMFLRSIKVYFKAFKEPN